jgi:hypothetical protein
MREYLPDIIFIITLVIMYFLPRKSVKYKFVWIIALVVFSANLGIRIYLINQKHKGSEKVAELQYDLNIKEKKITELEQKLAPRHITAEQRMTFIKLTKDVPKGEIPIFRGDAGIETSNYIKEIRELLDASGYSVNGRSIVPIIGLSVSSSVDTATFLLYADENSLPDYAVPVQRAFFEIGVKLLGLQYNNEGNAKLRPKQIAICIVNRN